MHNLLDERPVVVFHVMVMVGVVPAGQVLGLGVELVAEELLLLPEIVDAAWWLCLSRGPTGAERSGALGALTGLDGDRRREAVEDLMWSLLTSREFLFQH